MKLYLRYCSIILRSQMQYKSSFFMTAIGQFLVSFSMFVGIYFMFQRFQRVEAFSYNEVLLCFAVVLMSFSIAECFVRGFDTFSEIISNGEFDRIMVRPRNEIFQVLGSKIEFTRIGRFMQAVIIFFYAIPASEVIWTFDKIITLAFMIIGGVCLFAGLFVIYASLCFFTIEGLEFINIFTDGGREFGKYPLLIYGEGVLKFFTFVIPLALVQYYPLIYLIGRTSNKFYILLPLAGVLFLFLCYIFWRFGLGYYKSNGS
ncbi:MAG TPA: ABC-2 family transporter protein [Clostridia bacterium]